MVGVSQSVPLGMDGLSVNYGFANSWSNPGGPSGTRGFTARRLIANLGISYALLRELERNLFLTAALSGNNSSVDVMGEALSRDRTPWVSLGAEYDDVIDGVGVVLNPLFLQGVGLGELRMNPTCTAQSACMGAGLRMSCRRSCFSRPNTRSPPCRRPCSAFTAARCSGPRLRSRRARRQQSRDGCPPDRAAHRYRPAMAVGPEPVRFADYGAA